jgi:tRNA U34 2-thiouridine synthase MnmA/TrmU
MLAARVLMDQGIDVTGLSFTTPFFSSAKAEAAARQIGFPLLVRDISLPHLEMLKDPPSGYGSNMNPCVDCHALMIREAGLLMESEGWDFIFTGEVLNERPMSQNPRALNRVVKLAGYPGRVLRPLSALLMRETVPEREGKVKRNLLLDIQGRSRKRQFALAEKFGILDYPSPAGGCLLTDPSFSRRLRDLFDNGPAFDLHAIEMLKVGRHFRLRRGVKVAIGRNQAENNRLAEMRGSDETLLSAVDIPGPVAILSGQPSKTDFSTAAALCGLYSDSREASVPVSCEHHGNRDIIHVAPLTREEAAALRL